MEVREEVYAVRMWTVKKAVRGNENLYSRALSKDPFIPFLGVGRFGGIDHIDADFTRESLVESLFCGLKTLDFFALAQFAEELRVVEKIVVRPVVVGVGDIVQGLRVYLIDRNLSANSEAQDDSIPVINAVTDDNRLDIVGIEIIAPVNVIGKGALERVHKARVVDFERGAPVSSQVGIVEDVANPNAIYFKVFNVEFGFQPGIDFAEQSVNIMELFIRNGEGKHFAVEGFVGSFIYFFVLDRVSDNPCVVLFCEVVGKIAARDDAAGGSDCFEEYFGLRGVAAEIAPDTPVVPDEGSLAISVHEGLEASVRFSE